MKTILSGKKYLKCIIALFTLVCVIAFPVKNIYAAKYTAVNSKIIEGSIVDAKKAIKAVNAKSKEAVIDFINNDEENNYVEIVILKDGQVVAGPVWFDKNEKSWEVTVPEETGDYAIKLFKAADDVTEVPFTKKNKIGNDIKVAVGEIKTSGKVTAGKPQVKVADNSQTVQISVSDIKSTYPIKNVVFSIYNKNGKEMWKVNGKEDENKAGKYVAVVNAKKLTPSYGKYTVKVKVYDQYKANEILTKTAKFTFIPAKTSIAVKNVSKKNATFTIKTGKIYAASKIDKVIFRVWNKGEKIDAKNYAAQLNDNGTYSFTVDAKKHKYYSGTYNIKAIIKLDDGKKVTVGTKTVDLDLDNYIIYGNTNGKFIKKIYVYNPSVKKGVSADLWSKVAKGSDKKTYDAIFNADKNRLEIECKMSRLKGPGKAYLLLKDKSGSEIKKYTFDVEIGEIIKSGWHYTKFSNGNTYKMYYKNGKVVTNLTDVLKLPKAGKLYAEVNRKKCRVTIYAYDNDTKSWCIPVICFKCSPGRNTPGTRTPTGTFTTSQKFRLHELMGPSWGQYCTRITGGVLFHSVAGGQNPPYNLSARAFNKLGSPASHGCVRLCVRDAKWIYDYCASGMKVKIFDSNFEGPLEAQYVPKMKANQHYDPTDPAVKKK